MGEESKQKRELQEAYRWGNIKRYSQIIRSFGYQSVDVQMGYDLKLLDALFWDGYSKYGISCRCYSGDIMSEIVNQAFDDIFIFSYDKEVWQNDVREQFIQYLIDKMFYDIQIYSSTEEKIDMFAYQNNIKYGITLRFEKQNRKKIEADKKERSAKRRIYDNILDILRDFKPDDFILDIDDEMQKIMVAIENKYVKSYLEGKCYFANMYVDGVEEAFYDIVNYLGYENVDYDDINELVDYLNDNGFYDVQAHFANGNNGYVMAFRNDVKFYIKHYIERKVGYEEYILSRIHESDDYTDIEQEHKQRIDFDNMEGHDFEHFCAKILSKNGFTKIKVTQGSGDQGIDIIAYKDDIKYGIQCKCYSSDIGNAAVQEVYAGKMFYKCHVGIVLTNRYFTKSAMALAESNGIILWDRDKLIKLIGKSYE